MTSSPIPRFKADVTAEEVSAGLRDHGAVIIERLADAELCDRLMAELQPWLAETPAGADDFTGRNTFRTGALLTRCPSSVAMVAHPLILDVVDQTLWPKKTTFQLHLTQSIAIGPGSPAQMIHRDQWCFDFFPFPADVDVEVSSIWALEDFTETQRRHTRGTGQPSPAERGARSRSSESSPAEMPRGSVVLYLGSTFHGGGANDSDRVRVRYQRRLRARVAASGREPVPVVHTRRGAWVPRACATAAWLRGRRVRARVHRRWSQSDGARSIPRGRARRRASSPADRADGSH